MSADKILEKYKHLLHKEFVDVQTLDRCFFRGILVDDEDYYFLLTSETKDNRYVSCVVDLATSGFVTVKEFYEENSDEVYDIITENINRVVRSLIKDLDEEDQDEILERLQEQYRFYGVK